MKKYYILSCLMFLCIITSAQYIENPATDTNLYDVIAKWDTIIPQDTEADGEREQYERWKNFWLPRLSQDGNFQTAIDAYSSYVEYFESLKSSSLATSPSNKGKSGNDFKVLSVTANWQPLGPYTPVMNGGNQGIGQVKCIEFHPTDPNTIFAGTYGGGLWKTTDGGLNWNNLNTDFQVAGLCVPAFAISKSDNNVLFLSSSTPLGHGFFAGIYRSLDGGNTWQLANTGLTTAGSISDQCLSILIDPANKDIVYLATGSGLYKTTTATSTCQWNLLTTGLTNFRKIVFGPNTQTLYASGLDVVVSNDGGTTWTSTGLLSDANLSGRIISSINMDAVISGGSLYLYASVHNLFASNNNGAPRLIYFFDGTSWFYKSSPTSGLPAEGRNAITVSPYDPSHIAIGEVGWLLSINGGTTWPYSPPHCHNDIHDIKYQAGGNSTSSKVYLATDGGVCRYDNNIPPLNGFANYYTNGMAISTSYNIAGFTTSAARTFVLSGQQDCGTILYDTDLPGPQKWWYCSGGDGFENMIDYSDPLTMYTTTYSPNGKLYKSTDAKTFSSVFGSYPETAIWGAPLAIDPANPKTLYQGRIDIWKTTDGWGTRNKISNFNNDFGVDQFQAGTAIAIGPSNNKYIYYAVCGYPPSVPPARPVRMFRTTNGGGAGNWQEITPPTSSSNYTPVTGIAISDKNPDHVWVCYSGYDKDLRVKKSTDGGANWVDFNQGLPTFGSPLKSFPTNHIIYQKGSDDALYLATDIGVFYRDATMLQWEAFQDNLPNVVCSWLDIDYTVNKIRVGTHGRGVWESEVPCFKAGPDIYVKDTRLDNSDEPNLDNGPMWLSEDIWVRNQSDGISNQIHQNPKGSQNNWVYVRIINRGCSASSGTNENLRVYWAKAATALDWPANWGGGPNLPCGGPPIPFGGEITTGGGIAIPSIPAGGQYIAVLSWTPEDPSDYAPCNLEKNHFCLLARIEDPTDIPDLGMSYIETSSVGYNTKYNNNIAWKNLTVIDTKPIEGDNPARGVTIVRNIYEDVVLTKLDFSIPEGEEDNSFFSFGTVNIWLGDSLFQRWVNGGNAGENIEVCDDTLIHLLGPGAWIGNMALDTGEMYAVESIFDQYVLSFDPHYSKFNIAQYDSLISDTTMLTGGVSFLINTFSLDKLMLPDSLHNNPALSICCGDTMLITFPDSIMTGLSAHFKHWIDSENLFEPWAQVAAEDSTSSNCAQSHWVYYICEGETETYLDVEVTCSTNPTFIRIVACGNIAGDTLELKSISGWITDSLTLLLTDTCYNGDSLDCEEETRKAELLAKYKGTGNVEVFPNPTTGQITIKFNNEDDESYDLSITDLAGRILLNENVKANEGYNLHEVDLSRFNKGVYFIIFRSASTNKMVRVTRN